MPHKNWNNLSKKQQPKKLQAMQPHSCLQPMTKEPMKQQVSPMENLK